MLSAGISSPINISVSSLYVILCFHSAWYLHDDVEVRMFVVYNSSGVAI